MTEESKKKLPKNPVGRGAVDNPPNRFDVIAYEPDAIDEFEDPDEKQEVKTQLFKDFAKTIVTSNDSPDIPFRFSVNPYRGCEHGCAYCYARPNHEYLGLSAGLDFETKIFVKEKAAEMLRTELSKKSWKPESITFSGVTDCYQPIERKLRITRSCLEVLKEFKNPVAMITKNALVTRDIDILSEMAKWNGCAIFISITSLDPELCGVLEPRTSRPQARLDAVRQLSEAGIPVGVNVAPIIPGLNDHEMPEILKAAAQAGARFAGFVPIRLPLTVAPLFASWLERHKPERKEKVLNHIRSLRGGDKLNDSNFGSRMRGQGAFAVNLRQLFEISCKRFGLNKEDIELSTKHFKVPTDQLAFEL